MLPTNPDTRASRKKLAFHPNEQPPQTTLWAVAYLLLRKEVIQPHLPVRLPCYDFVPIASPTFDGSLPKG